MNLHDIEDAAQARAFRIQKGFRKLYMRGIVEPNPDGRPQFPFRYKIDPRANYWGYFSPEDATYWEHY